MIRRETLREYVNGSLWVWPGISALAALLVGFVVSRIDVDEGSPLDFLAFQGTAEDARALLIVTAGTVVTVIALMLGLTVVALQLSTTQFSPRLLRRFLRDRAVHIVLSVFAATFVYAAAGLYTVGLAQGTRSEQFPRLAVSGAVVLLFASMAAVVYFADHLAHSIQIDAIGARVEKDTVATVHALLGVAEEPGTAPPGWAVTVPASRSGYLQAVDAKLIVPFAQRHQLIVRFQPRVGEHVVAHTVLATVWTPRDGVPLPDPDHLRSAIDRAVRIGFERTLVQDAALGIRQLVDMACKALSPAINDPYTAVQAIDHLTTIFCTLAVRPLGDAVTGDAEQPGRVVVPGRRFDEYLATMCGLIRRYGSAEPAISLALIRLLANCATVLPPDSPRRTDLRREADLILDDATREIVQPADAIAVRTAIADLRAQLDVELGTTS